VQGQSSAGDLGVSPRYKYQKRRIMLKWLRPDLLLLLCTFLLEGLWVYLWLALLGHNGFLGWKETPLTPGAILLLLFAAYYSVQVFGQAQWSQRKLTLIYALYVIALFALVTRLENGGGYAPWDLGWLRFAGHNLTSVLGSPMQATVLLGVYLYWRGYHLSKEGLGQDQVMHSFLIGLIGVIVGLLSWEMSYRSGSLQGVSRGQALAVVIAFFFAALTALPLSHLLRVRAEMQRAEGDGAFFSQSWTLQLLGLTTAMVVVGLIAASIFSFRVLAPVITALGWVSAVASVVVYYLVYPIAFLGAEAFLAITWLLRKLSGTHDAPEITMPDFSALRESLVTREAPIPLWLILIKWALILFVAVLLVWLLTRMVLGRRGVQKAKEALEETHQSVGGWRDFLRDLLLGLFHLRWWLRDRADAVLRHIPVVSRGGGDHVPDGELEVRQMYGLLLARARQSGYPRKDAETPAEYLGTLKDHMPEDTPALEQLTDAYVAVRYGEQDAPLERKGALNRLWRAVYEKMRRSPQTPSG